MDLETLSVSAVYAALALYAIAFAIFAIDLSNRGAMSVARSSAAGATAARRSAARGRGEVAEANGRLVSGGARGAQDAKGATTTLELDGGAVLTLERPSESTRAAKAATRFAAADGAGSKGAATTAVGGHLGASSSPGSAIDADRVARQSRVMLRIAMTLTWLGLAAHVFADVTRGVGAHRVPWSNMYEFALTATAIIVAIFVVVNLFIDLRFVGTFVIGLVVLLLAGATVGFYVPISPLPPALQSYWLVIHVFIASAATAFLAMGAAMNFLHLRSLRRSQLSAAQRARQSRLFASLPSTERLENLAYRLNIVGFILWSFTLIAGAIWAERAWGRYWGFDTKEIWTFIIWVVYAGYLHAMATKGWRGKPSSILALIGFATVIFNFTVVNTLFKGLHAYSGL